MAKCGYCGSTIIMGGAYAGGQRYCNNRCANNAAVLAVAQHIPQEVFEQQVEQVYRGNCPRCGGAGPVDVHKIHQVWSVLVLTRWSSRLQVSCRSCATKSQLGGAAFSAVCGWWGIPWGLILTPVQITRNVMGMFGGPKGSQASDALRRLVLVNMGAQAIKNSRSQVPPPLPQ